MLFHLRAARSAPATSGWRGRAAYGDIRKALLSASAVGSGQSARLARRAPVRSGRGACAGWPPRRGSVRSLAEAPLTWSPSSTGGCLRRGRAKLLAHVSPLGWEHINLTGEYRWPGADPSGTAKRLSVGSSRAVLSRRGPVLLQAMGRQQQEESGAGARRPNLGRDAQGARATCETSPTWGDPGVTGHRIAAWHYRQRETPRGWRNPAGQGEHDRRTNRPYYGRDGRVFRCNGAARGVRIVTWAISRNPLRPGALVTAGDVCHLHPDRAAAERCGASMGGAPDLVRLDKHTTRVYRVLWSLSDVAGGELRKPPPPPAPAPATRPGAVRSWPEKVRISGPVAARAAWERLTGGDP